MDDDFELDDLSFDEIVNEGELRFKFRRELEIIDDETELFGDVN